MFWKSRNEIFVLANQDHVDWTDAMVPGSAKFILQQS